MLAASAATLCICSLSGTAGGGRGQCDAGLAAELGFNQIEVAPFAEGVSDPVSDRVDSVFFHALNTRL